MAQTERKELMTNELAKGITSAYQGLKKGPSRSTIVFVAVIIAVGVLAGLARYWWVSDVATDSKRWLLVDQAVFPSQVTTSLTDKELEDTKQLQALRFREARMKLARGVRNLGSSDPKGREEARKDVSDAKTTYEELSKKSSSSPQLHQESLWGAAKASEALGSPDDVKEAIRLYKKLSEEYGKSALGKNARKQIERLEEPATMQDVKTLYEELGRK